LGIRIPNQDAEAIARGNAFVATADNPSALYYNPAGITQLPGHNIHVGLLNYLGVISEYEAPNGSRAETDYEIVPVPQLHYVYTPTDFPLSFGLGVYAPYGLGLEWPTDTGFRTIALEGRLTYVTANPTVAWQAHRTLSLAVGPTFNYSKVKFRTGIGVPGGDPNDEFEFEGDDIAYGYHAGLLWKPHDQWAFGANYRSATTVDYEGDSQQSPYQPSPVDTSLELPYPQNVAFGVSYRPTALWNIEVGADWTDWNSVDTLVFESASQSIPLPLNWQSSWFYHFGVSRKFLNGFFASIGYFFSENSTSERNFNPTVPDTDLHVGSFGGGYRGKSWQWAAACQIIKGPWRTVDESQPNALSGESANGRYQLFVPTVSFTLGYKF